MNSVRLGAAPQGVGAAQAPKLVPRGGADDHVVEPRALHLLDAGDRVGAAPGVQHDAGDEVHGGTTEGGRPVVPIRPPEAQMIPAGTAVDRVVAAATADVVVAGTHVVGVVARIGADKALSVIACGAVDDIIARHQKRPGDPVLRPRPFAGLGAEDIGKKLRQIAGQGAGGKVVEADHRLSGRIEDAHRGHGAAGRDPVDIGEVSAGHHDPVIREIASRVAEPKIGRGLGQDHRRARVFEQAAGPVVKVGKVRRQVDGCHVRSPLQ